MDGCKLGFAPIDRDHEALLTKAGGSSLGIADKPTTSPLPLHSRIWGMLINFWFIDSLALYPPGEVVSLSSGAKDRAGLFSFASFASLRETCIGRSRPKFLAKARSSQRRTGIRTRHKFVVTFSRNVVTRTPKSWDYLMRTCAVIPGFITGFGLVNVTVAWLP